MDTPTSRILIAGGPRVGKTSLSIAVAHVMDVTALHTDDLIPDHDWTALPRKVAEWLDFPGPWVIEGVAVLRALRVWLASHPTGRPCERLFWSDSPKVERTREQTTMAKGCGTIWSEIRAELLARGVDVQTF
jgi:hypothetical protein